MSAIDFADGLKDREVSFTLFRTAMHQHDLAPSQGWDKTFDKLAESLGSDKVKASYAAGLNSIYMEITLYGNKLVKIYTVEEQLSQLVNYLKLGLVDPNTIYNKRYPLPLEQDDLLAAPLDALCVGQWDEGDGVTSFIFCSKQFIVEREALPVESLNDQVIHEYGEFDEIYGIRKRTIQLYDVVSLNPTTGIIEIRMDGLLQQKAADIEKRLRVIETKIYTFAETYGLNKILSSPINFFPCIKKLYDSTDGRIGEIGHSTESAAVHRGKTRGKKEDFRSDKYHAGGVGNIHELNAHMLTKRWDSPTKHGVVELEIPGTLSVLNSITPVIDIVHVLSCASKEDYNFVMFKLFEALKL